MSAITSYHVDMAAPVTPDSTERGAWTGLYDGTKTTCIATKLLPGRQYHFRACAIHTSHTRWSAAVGHVTHSPRSLRHSVFSLVAGVRATNAVGDGLFTEASFVAAAAVPTPPTALRVTKTTASSVTLAWEVPEDTNGAPVTNYTVESAQDVDSTRGFWPAFVGRELRCVCVVALLHLSCTVHAIPSESPVSFAWGWDCVCCGCHNQLHLAWLAPRDDIQVPCAGREHGGQVDTLGDCRSHDAREAAIAARRPLHATCACIVSHFCCPVIDAPAHTCIS